MYLILKKNFFMNETKNTKSIFIPGINKTKIKAATILDKNNIIAEGLLILVFLLLLRAQLGKICQSKSLLSQDKIPKLETAKWSSTNIAKNPSVYDFACLLAITDTIQYLIPSGESNVSVKDIETIAIDKWNQIKAERPMPGCRILPASIITEENICNHQHGLVLQNIGKWQAISLYDTPSLVKGISPTSLDIDDFILIYKNLLENLDVSEHPELSKKEMIIDFISNNLYYDGKSFYDEINFGLTENKLPLEKPFDVNRMIPKEAPKIKILEKDIENPLIKLLSLNLKQQDKKGKIKGKKKEK